MVAEKIEHVRRTAGRTRTPVIGLVKMLRTARMAVSVKPRRGADPRLECRLWAGGVMLLVSVVTRPAAVPHDRFEPTVIAAIQFRFACAARRASSQTALSGPSSSDLVLRRSVYEAAVHSPRMTAPSPLVMDVAIRASLARHRHSAGLLRSS